MVDFTWGCCWLAARFTKKSARVGQYRPARRAGKSAFQISSADTPNFCPNCSNTARFKRPCGGRAMASKNVASISRPMRRATSRCTVFTSSSDKLLDFASRGFATSAARMVVRYATIHFIQVSTGPPRAASASARRRRSISARVTVSSSRSAPGNSRARARSVARSATAPPRERARRSFARVSYLRETARSSSGEGDNDVRRAGRSSPRE